MTQADEKVVRLGSQEGQDPEVPEDFLTKSQKDTGRVALFVSLLTVILVVIFYFSTNQSIEGLSGAIKETTAVQEQVVEMNERMQTLERRLAGLESVPAEARRVILGTMLQDMAQRVGSIAEEAETEEQGAKLRQARELLQEVEQDLVK
jgi:hypothetical protein